MIELDPEFLIQAWLPVQVRVMALVFSAPIIGSHLVPIRFRFMIGVCIGCVIAPTVPTNGIESQITTGWLIGMLISELFVGTLIGLSLRVLLAAAKLVGELVESVSGLNLFRSAEVPNNSDGSETPISKLFYWTSLIVFICAGGVNQCIDGLMRSFSVIPPGRVHLGQELVSMLTHAVGQSFAIGCRAAIPALIALLITSIVVGLVQRGMPQFGGFHIGLSMRSIMAILVTSLLLLIVPWIVLSGINETMNSISGSIVANDRSIETPGK